MRNTGLAFQSVVRPRPVLPRGGVSTGCGCAEVPGKSEAGCGCSGTPEAAKLAIPTAAKLSPAAILLPSRLKAGKSAGSQGEHQATGKAGPQALGLRAGTAIELPKRLGARSLGIQIPAGREEDEAIIPCGKAAGGVSGTTPLLISGRRALPKLATDATRVPSRKSDGADGTRAYKAGPKLQCSKGYHFPHTGSANHFRINFEAFRRHIPELRDAAVLTAVLRAASTWNSQGNTGWFVYDGPTTDERACAGNVVTAMGVCDEETIAYVGQRCFDDNDIPRNWRIRVCGRRSEDGPNPGDDVHWTVGQLGRTSDRDLHQILVHEMGHVLGLGDAPGATAPSVMTGGKEDFSVLRDLRYSDIVCASKLFNDRNTILRAYEHQPRAFRPIRTEIEGVARGTPSLIVLGKYQYWAYGVKGEETLEVHGVHKAPPTVWGTEQVVAIGPRMFIERESRAWPSMLAYNSSGLEDQPDDWDLPHYVHILRSPRNTFLGGGVQASFLARCGGVSAAGRCEKVADVASPRMLATAFDQATQRTVYVWTNHTPMREATNREVMISFGSHDDSILNPAVATGLQSAVAAGVACTSPAFGAMNCLLAYVDQNDRNSFVLVRQFRGSPNVGACAGSGLPCAEMAQEELRLPATTADDIALWAVDGVFWVAVRSMEPGQPTLTWYSADGVGGLWRQGPVLEPSIVGPTVQNNFETAYNRLLIVAEP